MTTILSILVLVSSVILIISIMLQESNDDGMGALTGSSANEALFGANRGSSKQAILNRITIVSSIVFAVSLLILAAQ